ncbi:MAG: hypothetical protein ACR2MP_02170 [Streptosporangiaceae bacterium]
MFLVVGLPLTIAVGQEWGWVLFLLVMASGVCNILTAYATRRQVRRRGAPDNLTAEIP